MLGDLLIWGLAASGAEATSASTSGSPYSRSAEDQCPMDFAMRDSVLQSSGEHQNCDSDTPLSCSASSQSSCCYEGSNGVFLQTQFWDYSPATGPDDSWTIHGLWSDKCSGGFEQFCNSDWEIDSAESVLENLGLSDLVSTMNTYWKNQGHSDNELWTHEFNKHGTCMATVSPDCYESDAPQYTNVGDFFKSVVRLYETLPTYEWLKEAGIEPSEDQTWTVEQFTSALESHTNGKSVYLGCDRSGNINEVWYFYDLKGSVADGQFNFIDSVSTSSCTDGFGYLPKGSSGGGGGGDDGGSSSKGYLQIDGQQGCLISDGSWYSSGTCATYRIKDTIGGVSVSSSKGACGISGGVFKCGSGTTASDFELQDGYLSYGGSTKWSAESVPSGTQREAVSPGSGSVSLKIQFTAK